jgi:hypothetical protein
LFTDFFYLQALIEYFLASFILQMAIALIGEMTEEDLSGYFWLLGVYFLAV